jgi:hypothetical protein
MNIYSPTISGSLTISGSILTTGGGLPLTGSLVSSGSFTSIGNTTVTGSLLVSGSITTNSTITAQTLVVQTITSSITYSSGSNIFGSSSINTQQFTGSVLISGSSTALNVNSGIFFISSSGQIGIGTSTPATKLEIADANGIPLRFGDIAVSASNQTAGYIGMSTSAFSGVNGDLVLYPRTSTTSRILLMGGKVGIATTSPALALTVQADTTDMISWRSPSYEAGRLGLDTTNAHGAIFLYTSGSQNVQITAKPGAYTYFNAGNVGIGTSSPAFALDVNGYIRTNNQFRVSKDGSNSIDGVFYQQNVTAGSTYATNMQMGATGEIIWFQYPNSGIWYERMRLTNAGNLLIGQSSASGNSNGIYLRVGVESGFTATNDNVLQLDRLSSTGNIQTFYYAGSSVGYISTNGSTITFSGNALSDARHKENIQPIEGALDAINALDFVTFNYKENNQQKSAGVTAQQAQTVAKIADFVINGASEEDYKSFDYNALIGYLGKAIQELKAQNDALQARIETLEQK